MELVILSVISCAGGLFVGSWFLQYNRKIRKYWVDIRCWIVQQRGKINRAQEMVDVVLTQRETMLKDLKFVQGSETQQLVREWLRELGRLVLILKAAKSHVSTVETQMRQCGFLRLKSLKELFDIARFDTVTFERSDFAGVPFLVDVESELLKFRAGDIDRVGDQVQGCIQHQTQVIAKLIQLQAEDTSEALPLQTFVELVRWADEHQIPQHWMDEHFVCFTRSAQRAEQFYTSLNEFRDQDPKAYKDQLDRYRAEVEAVTERIQQVVTSLCAVKRSAFRLSQPMDVVVEPDEDPRLTLAHASLIWQQLIAYLQTYDHQSETVSKLSLQIKALYDKARRQSASVLDAQQDLGALKNELKLACTSIRQSAQEMQEKLDDLSASNAVREPLQVLQEVCVHYQEAANRSIGLFYLRVRERRVLDAKRIVKYIVGLRDETIRLRNLFNDAIKQMDVSTQMSVSEESVAAAQETLVLDWWP